MAAEETLPGGAKDTLPDGRGHHVGDEEGCQDRGDDGLEGL